ncbi:O-antigen/teichoic acid export membrane protein [Methanococcus maripaludis]|uniref:O-antigen/teichoic acid export membrane protein n=1 Tax=Methanococcus maripaludis TaxID=39152 RepID=A0A7J9P1B1_METMI|nr:polysaccharide biosynthesis C-terminal domain-containing protein [Methanococcus maripaludis]MBA2853113.1 O-antigen/teichoic acid export membrane protein [Methanococcus maripaludis]
MKFKYLNIDKSLLKYTTVNFVPKLVLAILSIFLARYFTKFEYGLYSTAMSLISFLFIFVMFGMCDYFLILISKKADIVKSISMIIGNYFVLSILGILIAVGASRFFPELSIAIIILFFIKAFFENLISFCIAVFQSKNEYNNISKIQIFLSISMIIAMVLTYVFKYTLLQFVFTLMAFSSLISVFWVLKAFDINRNVLNHISVNLQFNKNVLHESYHFFLSILSAQIYIQSDIILLSFISGPLEVSRYSVVTFMIMGLYVIPASLYSYFLPKLTYGYSTKSKISGHILQFKNFLKYSILSISLILFIFSSDILSLLYTSKYLDSSLLLKISSISYLIFAQCYLYSAVLTASGNQSVKSKLQLTTAMVNIILNIIVIPRYGAEGAAVTTLFSNIMIWIAYAFVVKRLGLLEEDYEKY